MYWSQLFIPTLREVPADAEVASHKLLLRAGYIRPMGSGIYNYLLLAQRSMSKIQKIIREEMEAIGAQEFHLAALNPAEVWQESGRWTGMGQNMFRLKDRWQRDLCLGMTHEEVMTQIARGELRSYKQLPQIWYQIQTKFRDEPRPKSGLLRVRQFLMKDSYSFDIDAPGLDVSYEKHRQAYCKIFERCGIEYVVVDADSGAMGGSASQEFMVATDAGEDLIAVCRETGYAANLEKAVSRPKPPVAADVTDDLEPSEIHTPGAKTIDELAVFLKVDETALIKSVVVIADFGEKQLPVLALMRGNHQLSETKFAAATGCKEYRAAHPEEIRELFGADPGSLGPVGVKNMAIWADSALEGRKNMVTGANKNDYHLLNVTPGEDFEAKFADIRQVESGDAEVTTGAPLELVKTMEIGHIFKLGYKYSNAMGLDVLDSDGKEVKVIMGSYGIGVERVLCGAVELYNDADGISMPASIAPFEVVLTPVNLADEGQKKAAFELYDTLKKLGIDVLLDDRDERPGVKFKDADLIGIPFRVTLGKKLAQGIVEVVERRGKVMSEVALSEVTAWLKDKLGK